MYTSETGGFRLHQALADLNRQRLSFPLAPIRRIGAGLGVRASGVPDLQRRLEWYFSGKVPAAELRRDGLVHGALLMASALPEDDYDSFIAANVLLLVERLSANAGRDDGFWNWKRLAPHFRLAAPDLRAAIMCGFREARRAGRVSLSEGPGAEDCLTVPRNEILGFLGQNRVDLWVTQHSNAARLPDGQRQMALAGFRYLYERPLSMEPPASADAPVIPGLD
jgi:hypothetical protein